MTSEIVASQANLVNADVVPVIPLRRIKRWRVCQPVYARIAALYPDGVPLTREAARTLSAVAIDVMWAADFLLTAAEREQLRGNGGYRCLVLACCPEGFEERLEAFCAAVLTSKKRKAVTR